MAFTNEEKKLLYWQLAVEGMDILNIPDGEYEAAQKSGKYDRFTTFVKEFSEKLLGKSNTGVEFFGDTNGLPFFNDGELKEGWWQQAVDLGRGKIPKNIILPIIYEPSEETIKAVYSTFMPAYRALTESFAKRSIFQWIFNHAQYTAERDAIRGLRGLMMCLTAKTSAELKPHLDNYRENGPSVVRTFEQRKALLARMRVGEEVNAYEDEVLLMPENINERMQDQESISVNESEDRNNNIVIENNNVIENNIDLENEQVVFNPGDIDQDKGNQNIDEDFKDIGDNVNSLFDDGEADEVGNINDLINDISFDEPIVIGQEGEQLAAMGKERSENDHLSVSENNDESSYDADLGNYSDFIPQEEDYEVPVLTRLDALLHTRSFKENMMKEIMKAISISNVDNKEKIAEKDIYEHIIEICQIGGCNNYDDMLEKNVTLENLTGEMSNFAITVFEHVYSRLNNLGIDFEKKPLIAQQITDLFLNNASPIAFHSKEFGNLGKQFALRHRDHIISSIQDYESELGNQVSEEQCNKIIGEAMNELSNGEMLDNDDSGFDDSSVSEERKSNDFSVSNNDELEKSAENQQNDLNDSSFNENGEEDNGNDNEGNEEKEEKEDEHKIEEEPIAEQPIVQENAVEEPVVEPIVEEIPSVEAAPIILEIHDQSVENNNQAEENKNEEDELDEQNNEFNLFDYDSAAPATGAALNADGAQNNEFNLFDNDAAQPAQPKQDNLVDKPEEKSEELLFDKPVEDEPEPEEEVKNEPEQVKNQEPQDYYHNPDIYVPILEYITTYYHTDLNVEGEEKENIKNEISNILSDSGMGEDDIAGFIENIDAIIVGMDLAMIGARVTEEEDAVPAMENMVMESYKLSYSLLEENNFGSNVKERAEMAQKVADMLLKNYSPVALANGAMDQYANRYLFTSRKLTNEFLFTFVKDLNELNELIFQLTGKRVVIPQPEQPIQQPVENKIEIENGVKEENEPQEENKVEAPVVEEPVVEAPENDEEIAKSFVNDILNGVKLENEEEINEQPEEEVEELKPVSNSKRINDVLKEKCERRIRDADIAVATRQQLFKIFRNPSFENEKLITAINIANEIPQSIADQFEKARYDLITNQGVERMMKSIFSEALSCTEECGFDLAFRIGIAQRITDLMMKDYSLVAIVPHEFDTYADNYIVLHKGILNELIKDQTKDLSEEEVSDLMKRVDKEMAPDLIGWNARNFEHVYGRELLPYEKLYQNIMGEQAPELNPVSIETYLGYKAQYEEKLKDFELTKSVKEQIAEIYAEAGINESQIDAAVNKAFDKLVDITTKTYKDLQKVTDYLKTAKDMMEITVKHTLDWVHPYVPVEGLSERIVIGQKITDVFLKNYSPIAFVNGDLDKFSDNYICSNNERIESWLTDCNVITKSSIHEIPGIINGVEKLMNRAMVVVEEEVYEEPAEELDDDDIDDVDEEIEEKNNDVPAPEENNVDAQKERMLIPELAENIAGKDGYPKVDEDAVSAVSDKQI